MEIVRIKKCAWGMVDSKGRREETNVVLWRCETEGLGRQSRGDRQKVKEN